MKDIFIHRLKRKKTNTVLILFLLISIFQFQVNAQSEVPLRRPISPNQPMWLMHIDTWNYADPQKIIDLIPEDIKPYVVMNISLSISHDETTSRFKVAEYGYEIAKSWLRTCAQNQMWAVVQVASGGYAQFSDTDLSMYEEFYQDYPNLIGFNYAEQFWGYGDTDPLSADWSVRVAHFADMLKLSNKYGGYLVVSWCGNQWSPNINPIAMLKRNPDFAEASSEYTKNYILCEKYTQQSYQSDMESLCLGAYLSGYSGNYGIRYDDTGWTDTNGEHENFTMATAGAVHLEHVMLTGETVIDGPELIWTQCFYETNRKSAGDGYTMRNWDTFSQFDNVSVDIFRKILDGTIRIPTRQEVIDRTKFVIINDVNSGTDNDKYSSPRTLFEGLYRMDGDGNYENNKTFFKKSGRYPTVPTVYQLDDDIANSFQYKINSSDYSNRWTTVADKVNEFNEVFPQEYTGDIYAGRYENSWVVYNPYKTGQKAGGNIPFKYNTSESMELNFSQYTAGVVKEYADKVTFYLSNYDNELNTGLKTDTIKILDSSSEPTYSYEDRGSHSASIVTSSWENGVFTLIVKHNGSLDITVNCSGSATDRLTAFTEATLTPPAKPDIYTGPRQYEAECFDYKSIASVVTGGYYDNTRNYTGQGYLRFGTSSSASVRDTVYALRKGTYQLNTRYSVAGGDVSTIDLFVNGTLVATPVFAKTGSTSTWNINTQNVELEAGANVIIFKANKTNTNNLYFDNMVITQGNANNVYTFSNDSVSNEARTPAAEFISVQSGSAGVVSFTDGNTETSNCFKTYSAGSTNKTGVADLDMFPTSAGNYSVMWKEYYVATGGKKGVLLRGTGENGSCSYAEGMKQGYAFIAQNNEDNTITLISSVAEEENLVNKSTYTSTFTTEAGKPYWLRASVYGNQLKFECSTDSLNWEGSAETMFTDSTYSFGSTQLVWGLNSENLDWLMDNITYSSGNISVSRLEISALNYAQGEGPSTGQSFSVTGNSLISPMVILAPDNFEVSLDLTSGYDSSLTIVPIEGDIPATNIYVRLKSGLSIDSYSARVKISTDPLTDAYVTVSGEVSPTPVSRIYDFSNDAATTGAQTPPAWKTAIGKDNGATAGVVSYTDANGFTSNMLTPYSTGQRNSTGVIDLNLFSTESTDYSVTWKQYMGSDTYYKVGVIMRGDTENIGDAATGYVQGIMQGYLILVYTAGSENRTEFRIYSSTADGLNLMINNYTTFAPEEEKPVWYRAIVSGFSPVTLKMEYSTDSITWKIGSLTTDVSATGFKSGATQLVWGLAVTDVDFYIDDITFNGLESEHGTPDLMSVSTTGIDGLTYKKGFGPSASQWFSLSGSSLTNDVEIQVPLGYEAALDSTGEFSQTLTVPQNDGFIQETNVYVRLKAGLDAGSYNGNINVFSSGTLGKTVAISGAVTIVDGINDLLPKNATVVSIEYYTITGQKVYNVENRNGIYIVRKLMSDGSVISSKIMK